MALPAPKKWATRITKLLNAIHQIHPDIDRFPVNVKEIAREISNSIFPNEPITLIHGSSFSGSFEGALIPNPTKNGEWAILYNDAIESSGRINFTLAHELGHYLQHRHLFAEGKHCTRQEMLRWQTEEMKIEAEANIFAANLLMPLDDFSKSIYGREISRELILDLAKKYQTSISATALRWLDVTNIPAMIVSAKEGIIDWARSNDRLYKSGIYLTPKQKIIELPKESLAIDEHSNEHAREHKSGVWPGTEVTQEILLSKNPEYSLLLLVYPKTYLRTYFNNEENMNELHF